MGLKCPAWSVNPPQTSKQQKVPLLPGHIQQKNKKIKKDKCLLVSVKSKDYVKTIDVFKKDFLKF